MLTLEQVNIPSYSYNDWQELSPLERLKEWFLIRDCGLDLDSIIPKELHIRVISRIRDDQIRRAIYVCK